ncbi:MAG: Ig-like domain-containing protein, partial [Pseudomonadota bacterium]
NYYPDEWLTFYMHVRLGEYGGDSHDTHVTLWAARESDSEYTMVIDRADIDLGSGPNHDAIWLLPFNTDRSADPTRQDTYTLYDELIVSANPIPVPTTGLSFGFFASETQVEAGSTVSLSWNGDVANTCIASGDWSGNKAGAGTEVVGPLTANSQFVLQCFGAEGNSTRTAVVTVVPADLEPPSLEQATAVRDPNAVKVTFSEGVGQAGAESLANYTVTPAVTLTSAIRESGSDSVVRLATSTLVRDTQYTVTVNNVTDQSNAQNAIAPGSQLRFEYFPSLAGSNTQPPTYQWSVLAEGAPVYVDRPFTYANVPPQYLGFDYLVTANNDKNGTGDAFLTFELNEAATVLIGHDRRIASKPAWLDDWADSGTDILTSDATFDVFRREFEAGTVTLGGNEGNGNSMYFVLTGPVAPPANSLPRADFDAATTQANVAVAIDVLANDSGLADAPVSVRLTNVPANGKAFVRNNRIVYTPAAGYTGLDRLGYRVTDANGDSDEAVATITVSGGAAPASRKSETSAVARMIINGGGGAAHPGVLLLALLVFLRRARPAAAAGLALATLLAVPANASPLSEAAAAMSPGTFVELPTEGLSRDMMTQNGCGSPITSYSDNAVWDAASRRFLFVGGPHGCPHAFVEFREVTNTWSNLAPLEDSATHAYDHTTIDPAGRTLYFRKHSGGGFHAYDLISADWTLDALPTPPSSFTQVSGGLEFFPDIGRLVHINYGGAGEIDVFTGAAWNRLGSVAMGERAAFIEYNPVHGLVLFGGGVRGNGPTTVNRELHVFDSGGNLVQRADAPIGLAITKSIVTADPVSGKYLVFGNSGVFYEYDVIADAWRNLDITVPFLETVFEPDSPVFGTVAAPVSTHGVVMFLQYLGSGSKVWLYKHEDSGPPDTTPPSVPANISGSADSDTSITLTWADAVDAQSGVFSYEVHRNGALIGSAADTTYTDTGLADATAYSYRVAAVNGSGVVGALSPARVVSTLADVQPPAIVGAEAFGDAGSVTVTFSEPVAAQTAADPANYAINGGVSVFGAQAGAGPREIVLATSTLNRSQSYTLTVSNVTDQATTPNWIMPGSQVAFEFLPSLAGDNVVPEAYAWGRLSAGEPAYIDRAYFYTNVPASYAGLDYLLTANNDKGGVGDAFVTFDLPEPATLYVAHDVRATAVPAWLGSWTATGDTITTDDTTFDVFAREYSAGPVSLGGNEGSSPSMYTVIIGPGSAPPDNAQPKASNDSATTREARPVGIDVLANDSGLEDEGLVVSVATAPAHGAAFVLGGRLIGYMPEPGFTGFDTLSYRVTDGDGDSSVATVTIKVFGTGRKDGR